MVTISRNTLSGNLGIFIRDVLNHNIANPRGKTSQWFFYSNPEIEFKSDYPRVMIEEENIPRITVGQAATKNFNPTITVNITVYTDDFPERDSVANSIQTVLINPLSKDQNGDSFQDNMMKPMDLTMSTRDTFIQYPRMLRIKEIKFTLRYYGG